MGTQYIGITDFTEFRQVEHMLRVLNDHRLPSQQRRLHVGVMMSYKTLCGLETKWSKAFPQKELIADIFACTNTFNCLHYADYDAIDVGKNLSKAIGYGGKEIHATQLDMVWPDPKEISFALSGVSKSLEVILQVNSKSLELADNNPVIVAQRISEYRSITHVLLDKSMGRGLGMDAKGLLPFARAIKCLLPSMNIVVAGGLGPQTLHLVEPLLLEFPDISIDAQGKLRPSGSALDPIDWAMAEEYLIKALKLLP